MNNRRVLMFAWNSNHPKYREYYSKLNKQELDECCAFIMKHRYADEGDYDDLVTAYFKRRKPTNSTFLMREIIAQCK